MASETLSLSSDLRSYLQAHSVQEPPLLTALREETIATFEAAPMQIAPEQGQFFRWLLSLMNAKKVLEVGTFTGYSATCMALALPADGTLLCCDVSVDWTRLAIKYWKLMGLTDKITLRIAPALKTLQKLLDDKEGDSFDFIFIDADKLNYLRYYEFAVQLARPGGVIAIDNVLWNGEVINLSNQDENTNVIRNLNQRVATDDRVEICMLPIADGLTLARKK